MNAKHYHFLLALSVALLLFVPAAPVLAQGFGLPLHMQGLDHTTLESTTSRALGGTTIGLQNDAALMFVNPATLQSLKGMQISVAGLGASVRTTQVQQYGPLKDYPNFSLLMEGLTGSIPNPAPDTSQWDPGDSIQRPYDAIGPNWSHKKDSFKPSQIVFASPFAIGEMKFAAGLGYTQYADMNDFFQNNNVLSPSFLNLRPVPINDMDSLPVAWSQYIRSRTGSIKGYGGSLSGSITDQLVLGAGVMILKGSTDDYEYLRSRGVLMFRKISGRKFFRLDSLYDRQSRTGTSDFSGTELTFSGMYLGKYVTAGFTLRPPTTITREYTTLVQHDTAVAISPVTLSGSEKMKLPWRGSAGLGVTLASNLHLGFEYEIRSYAAAQYTATDGTTSKPWLSFSTFRVGIEYAAAPWLAVRAGLHEQTEVYEETGNPLEGTPVSGSVYSAGFGIVYSGIHLNGCYEYSLLKYQDVWQSVISINHETRHAFSAELVYDLPWLNAE
jgi:opacity protein-like surface antigen